MKKCLIAFILASALLNGCASILNGSTQNFKIATNNNFDVANTHCNVSNYHGSWDAIPNSQLIIRRDSNTLDIKCENSTQVGSISLQPDLQTIYLFNDIALGILIPIYLDIYNSAFYQYSPITAVDMVSK